MKQATTALFVQMLRKQGKQVGDVVRIKRKPHYIHNIKPDCMTFVSMDERKEFVTLRDKD